MKLLVIDGNSIVNRAYYGMHPLNNQEGFPTHAIYGFLNIQRRIREEVDPDGVCVAQGAISRGGVPIICMPHHLSVRIEGGGVDA